MVLTRASRLLLMLILITASSSALANSDALSSDTDFDLDMLQFLGETEELESFGVDLDDMLGIDDSNDLAKTNGGSK